MIQIDDIGARDELQYKNLQEAVGVDGIPVWFGDGKEAWSDGSMKDSFLETLSWSG